MRRAWAALGRTRRLLVTAAAVLAVAAAVATQALNHSTSANPADRRGTVERVDPGPGPSPSCSWAHEAGPDATADARPGDGEFRAVPADSLCSAAEPRARGEAG
ncbi:hypothetical protein [Streptomyces abyssomicinicus]|uniref:hypothetical protein n=1 Tax=Streptomyces abyssomicinicus TaxID=574929 RepID=UPI0013DEF651|nr:hypothetical protein [Streptomyces abyssomicinicus]